MNPRRARRLRDGNAGSGPVVYWMSRDQRIRDNWALLFAQQRALEQRRPLAVLFCLVGDFLGATKRHYKFMLKGLENVRRELEALDIPWILRIGDPTQEIPRVLDEWNAAELVTDFDPLRIKRTWKNEVCRRVSLPVFEVDAHNIVPCWVASPKQEYGAYTIRPKLHRLLPEFLDAFPHLERPPFSWEPPTPSVDVADASKKLVFDADVPEVPGISAGSDAANAAMRDFIERRLDDYPEKRNDPNAGAQSGLSPYLHFGQLSAQRLALEVTRTDVRDEAREDFLEELIVRRELADNFCFYNDAYDSTAGFPDWAKTTLRVHTDDPREHFYALETFERAETHDTLWNAAQRQMVATGTMHGYMRMYWCKKILEWSPSPEKAVEISVFLNDRYSLDGRDPNGYTGIAWSIGGVHDRAWKERPVFGKIRFMNRNGCARKFDVEQYVATYPAKAGNSL